MIHQAFLKKYLPIYDALRWILFIICCWQTYPSTTFNKCNFDHFVLKFLNVFCSRCQQQSKHASLFHSKWSIAFCLFSIDFSLNLGIFEFWTFPRLSKPIGSITGLWQMFRTFVLRCDWSILRILKSIKKHERQSERVTLVSIHNSIFRLYLS